MASARGGSKGGRTGFLLLVLAGLVFGYGGWNYRRNAQAEQAEYRPYRGYSVADLDALVAAYRAESQGYRQRYEKASGRGVRIREGTHIGDKIREFERVQRISRSTRELGSQLAERDVALGQLERERARRAEQDSGLAAFLRRVFVYRPGSSSSSSTSSTSS